MTDIEALIVHLNPSIQPFLNSLAADSPSSSPADQIYFCLARLQVLTRGVVQMLESESNEVRTAAQGLITDLSHFTASAENVERLMEGEEE